jgi:hypothetical protein
LQGHSISRLPATEEKASKRGSFAETRIGDVHIDSWELRLAKGRLVMFLAIDHVSRFAVVAFSGGHLFDRVCNERGIQQRLSQLDYPSTTDKPERLFVIRPAILRLPMGDRAAQSRA